MDNTSGSTTASPVGSGGTRGFPSWGPTALVLAAVALRASLPFAGTDTMLVYERFVDSLTHSHGWGRQVLVGAFEFPLLPTVSLLAARVLSWCLPWDGPSLLLAVCQVWVVSYLIRLAPDRRRRVAVSCGLVVSLVVPDVRAAFRALDPHASGLVCACMALFHLVEWHRVRRLRDATVCAIACGLLVFAGLPLAAFGAVLLVVASRSARRKGAEDGAGDARGMVLLLWAPFFYGVILLLLWNWLVMGHGFFPFRGPWAVLQATGGGVLAERMMAQALETSFVVYGALGALVLACVARWRAVWIEGLVGLIAVLVGMWFVAALGMVPPGVGVVEVVLALGMLLLPFCAVPGSEMGSRLIGPALVVILCAAMAIYSPTRSPARRRAFRQGAPEAETLTSYIDRFWPQSRIFVFGVRAPALYHDAEERRFVARLDYHEAMFLETARDEQLHLLVPPDNGRFYPDAPGPFRRLHRSGAEWLLLERTWPSGWQLWRCVLPPAGESKLDPVLKGLAPAPGAPGSRALP